MVILLNTEDYITTAKGSFSCCVWDLSPRKDLDHITSEISILREHCTGDCKASRCQKPLGPLHNQSEPLNETFGFYFIFVFNSFTGNASELKYQKKIATFLVIAKTKQTDFEKGILAYENKTYIILLIFNPYANVCFADYDLSP